MARGWRIVARNARTRYGEIDLVCDDGEGYVFVEVKTRRANSFVSAYEAADRRKVERLKRLALGWLALNGERDARWRLALAAVTSDGIDFRVEVLNVLD